MKSPGQILPEALQAPIPRAIVGSVMQPFVKWVGGKGQMLPALRKAIPAAFSRYIEPMVGGGALFFDLASRGLLADKSVILADTNEWLIKTYELVRDDPDHLSEILEELRAEYFKSPETFYYQVRQAWNDGIRNSARFIFLKQTSFNGLWRYNRAGELNMPWGKYAKPRLGNRESLNACARALQGVELRIQHYRELCDIVRPNDFVYLDPPYYKTFDGYAAASFSGVEHVNLVAACGAMTARGAHVVYTHQDGPDVRRWIGSLWAHSQVRRTQVRRYVNRDGGGRGKVVDLVVSSDAPPLRPAPHKAATPVPKRRTPPRRPRETQA